MCFDFGSHFQKFYLMIPFSIRMAAGMREKHKGNRGRHSPHGEVVVEPHQLHLMAPNCIELWLKENRVHTNSESVPTSTHTPSQAEMLCPTLLLKSRCLGWVTHEAKTKRTDCSGGRGTASTLSRAPRARGGWMELGGWEWGQRLGKPQRETHGPVGKRYPHWVSIQPSPWRKAFLQGFIFFHLKKWFFLW